VNVSGSYAQVNDRVRAIDGLRPAATSRSRCARRQSTFVGVALPFSPLGPLLGFVSPPAPFMAMLVALVALYLPLAQFCKQLVYRRNAAAHRLPRGATSVADARPR
jgi:Mg2+-importing ATPase